MSSPSFLAQVQSARIGRNALIGLSVGLFLGLALGLMIGWVWWPVEWTGNGPASATGIDQMAYLSAVADAYAAQSSPAAAALAQERLAALGDELPNQLDAAIATYAAQPGRGVQVSNLVALAAAVGAPIDVQNNAALKGSTAPAFTGASAAGAAAAALNATQGKEEDGNWFGWLFSVLMALLLIGGGLYVAWWYFRNREAGNGPGLETQGDELPAAPTAPPPEGNAPPYSGRTVTGIVSTGAAADATGTEYAFDREVDEGGAPRSTRTVSPYYTRPASELSGQASVTPLDDDDDFDADEESELANEIDRAQELNGQDERPDEPDSDDGVHGPGPVGVTAVTQAASQKATAPSPLYTARQDRYTVLDNYTAIYTAGMMDFDRTRNVDRPQGTGYIGEYGIGINTRYGALPSNPDQVVALDAYLFDKSDETAPLTVTRTLLSEYAADKMYSTFEREKQNGAPISAQPNTRFQLEGRQLLLDCLITAVTYTREGIFQTVTVEMNLKRKT